MRHFTYSVLFDMVEVHLSNDTIRMEPVVAQIHFNVTVSATVPRTIRRKVIWIELSNICILLALPLSRPTFF